MFELVLYKFSHVTLLNSSYISLRYLGRNRDFLMTKIVMVIKMIQKVYQISYMEIAIDGLIELYIYSRRT